MELTKSMPRVKVILQPNSFLEPKAKEFIETTEWNISEISSTGKEANIVLFSFLRKEATKKQRRNHEN